MFGKRHDNVVADIRTQIEYAGEEFSLLNFQESNFKSRGKQYPKFNLTEEAFTLVVFSYNTKEAVQTKIKFIKEFKRMKESIQNHASSSSNLVDFEKQLIGVKYATEILRADEPSKLRMLTEAHKAHGVPTNHLPDYVDEELKVSLTQLLKEHGVKMSAAKVNTRMIELGLLEFKERPSSKGGTKEFKSLTEAGRVYGDNAISPYNSKETQPLYYPSRFSELLALIANEVI
ncbi:Rha family transcriptional regulator [Lysinibacillus capsici]